MMPWHLYRGYEFLIRSELPIPGAIPLPDTSALRDEPADIEIALGSAILSGPARCEGPYRYAAGNLLFEMPGIANYLCEDGRRITIEPMCGASVADIADMLIATALPALLWMHGEAVLHAAGFLMKGCDQAIAVCGPSGSGKSTVLRSLIPAGGKVVGDDTLRLRFSSVAVTASGLPTRYCWANSVGLARDGHEVRSEQTLASACLGPLFILECPRSGGDVRFERISGMAALREMLVQRHRPRVPRLIGKEASMLARFAILAGKEIYRWHRPEGAVTVSEEEIAFLTSCARIVSPSNRKRNAP